MKLKKCIFSILFFSSLFILWHTYVYAGELELKNLSYDVTLNADGSANVKETWDISIEDTNTLFKTFEIDSTKYSDIINVSLVETTGGIRKNFSRIYQEKYHVDKDCFYALINSSRDFEIAWGVHEDSSHARRTFEMSYTIVDAVKNYADCSEFYWQFIGTDSAIPAKKVTGTITLPANVANLDDFRVWAHGPLNGNINKASNNKVSFEVQNLSSHTMLEIRIVTPTNIFAHNNNSSLQNKLSQILAQEQRWADEANREREAVAARQRNIIFFFVITNVVGIILAIILIKKIKAYKLELQKAPDFKPTMPSKYFRDIPNENSTPAQAAFLYYFKTSSFSIHASNVFSATMLDLCLKKYLSFEILGEKKNEIKITLTPNMDTSLLPKAELEIYEILEQVSSSKEFTMKDFEAYCKKHSSAFLSKYNNIETYAKEEAESQGNYDKNLYKQYNNWLSKGIGYFFLFIVSIPFMIVNVIPSIICTVYCFKISGRYNTLTQKGVDEKEAWVGLKNYMQDFSMMEEKEVPELILWEKYLVFATAFGIADTVLKQLKVIYPQINDVDYMTSHGYAYLYWMSYGNFSHSFIHTINNSITSTYSSLNYSSGSGSGGGFSSGGGFGGGGGRNGWKIKF